MKQAAVEKQEALDDTANVSMARLLPEQSSTPESLQKEEQEATSAALEAAIFAKAKAHVHELERTSNLAPEEASQVVLAADEQAKQSRKLLADNHFGLPECVKQCETHELIMRRGWDTETSCPGFAWINLNVRLSEEVLAVRQECTKENMKTVLSELLGLSQQLAMALLCPLSKHAIVIGTYLEDYILTCTKLELTRTTLLIGKQPKADQS